MRTNYASLAVFAGLGVLVTGDGLPPDAIPIQCNTICGPMVELTAMCDIHNSHVRRRRSAAADLQLREWVPKLAVEPKIGRAVPPVMAQMPYRPVREDDKLVRRNFTTIRPAPTSFPPEQLGQPTLDLRPTTALHHIDPIIVDPISQDSTPSQTDISLQPSPIVAPEAPIVTPEAPDDDADPPLSTLPVQPPAVLPPSSLPPSKPVTSLLPPSSSSAATTTVTLGDVSKTLSSPPTEATGDKEQKGTDNGNAHPVAGNEMSEEKCVCLNTSFDVAQVAALCSSCIAATGDASNNAQIIVDTCNFAPQTYTQAKDKIVNNIRVKAARPANAWDQGSSVDNSGPALSAARSLAARLAIGTVGFLLGSAILL